jgi:hypothetical protein
VRGGGGADWELGRGGRVLEVARQAEIQHFERFKCLGECLLVPVLEIADGTAELGLQEEVACGSKILCARVHVHQKVKLYQST